MNTSFWKERLGNPKLFGHDQTEGLKCLDEQVSLVSVSSALLTVLTTLPVAVQPTMLSGVDTVGNRLHVGGKSSKKTGVRSIEGVRRGLYRCTNRSRF